MARVPSLQIIRADDIVWSPGLLDRKKPKLYVAIYQAGPTPKSSKTLVGRTPPEKRGLTPTWNKTFPLPIEASGPITIRLHETGVFKDPCLGEICIDKERLLELYSEENGAAVEISAKSKRSANVFIRVLNTPARDVIDNVIGDVKKITTDVEEIMRTSGEQVAKVSEITMDEGVESVLRKLNIIISIGDEIAKIHPYAQTAWAVLTSAYKVVKRQQETDEKLLKLVQTMVDVYSFVEEIEKLRDTIRKLEATVLEITKETVECAIFIREYARQAFSRRVAQYALTDTQQIVEKLSSKLLELKESLKESISVHNVFSSAKLMEKVEELIESDALKILNPTEFNAAGRSVCIPGTRQDILAQIMEWLAMPSDTGNILWLHGVAGAGKSTISTTVTDYFSSLDRLGAGLFCRRGDTAGSSPDSAIRTIAYRLAKHSGPIRTAICEAIAKESNIVATTIENQFQKLLLGPLVAAVSDDKIHGPIIIVLDALDECGQVPRDRQNLVSLIANEFSKLPTVFRFLITSRPDSDISSAFELQPLIRQIQLNTHTPRTQEDIFKYIDTTLEAIRRKRPRSLDPDWPRKEAVQTLTDCSGGLFQWASLATKFIDSVNPQKHLDTLLKSSHKLTKDLDALYMMALQNSIDWENDSSSNEVLSVLGAVVLSRAPLTGETMDSLLGLGLGITSELLRYLGCVLQWSDGQSVRLLHASFGDYLTDEKRSGHLPWFIDSKIHSRHLALRCLEVLNQELHFNICNLEDSHVLNVDVPHLSERIAENIAPPLSYAAQFWAQHLREAGPDQEIVAELGKFMHTVFLYWLEALSLLECITSATECLLIAANYTVLVNGDLNVFIRDALRFVAAFAPVISQSAPHLYISALPFAARNSSVRQHFAPHFPQTLQFEGVLGDSWPSLLKLLEGHTTGVASVAFSPDGNRIVSGSQDRFGIVRVWDSHRASMIGTSFECPHPIKHLMFSANGKQIISVSASSVIQIWDCDSGALVATSSEIAGTNLLSVALSLDGKRIALGSTPTSWTPTLPLISVRDSANCEPIGPQFQTHNSESWCEAPTIAFSPDGKHIVAGWGQHMVRVWDCETGRPAFTCQSNPSQADIQCHCVAFSLDGTCILSGWSDLTVTVWNTQNGDEIRTLALEAPPPSPLDREARADSVAFSPDGRSILGVVWAIRNIDRVLVWDVETGELMCLLEGHPRRITSVAFSPDSGRIVAGSGDTIVRIWDTEKRHAALDESLEMMKPRLASIKFSPDSKLIALSLFDPDGPITRVLDHETGAIIPSVPLNQDHGHFASAVAFSPDSKQIAWGSKDGSVRVWDSRMNAVVAGPPDSESGKIKYVVFSLDGNHIVSTTGWKSMQIWSSETGLRVAELTLEYWNKRQEDADEERIMLQFTRVRFKDNVIFYQEGQGGDRFWEWSEGSNIVQLRPWGRGANTPTPLARSADRKLVLGAHQTLIWAKDAETRVLVAGPFECYTEVYIKGLSPDGTSVICGCRDGTIRKWQVR